MHNRLGLCAGLLLAVSTAWGQTSNPSSSPPSHIASVTATAPASPDAILMKDMSYADARKALIAHGWIPTRDPECKDNIGDDAASQRLCDNVPELIAYSEEGYAPMLFSRANDHRKLVVLTYGTIEDWKVLGSDSGLNVVDWHFQK